VASNLALEDFVFSAGGGFLFGTAAGFAIKKVMKIAAVVIGLFVAALAYLSYKGLIDVKWVAMETFLVSFKTLEKVPDIHCSLLNFKVLFFSENFHYFL
jgi:uncharacterized membrane protein (Fun14 family)